MITTFLTTQEERLWIADPKAINHVLKNSTTLYRKPDNLRELISLTLDHGLAWADGNVFLNLVYSRVLTPVGDIHKRQKRNMAPAFGLIEAKGLLPYFAQSVTKVTPRSIQI